MPSLHITRAGLEPNNYPTDTLTPVAIPKPARESQTPVKAVFWDYLDGVRTLSATKREFHRIVDEASEVLETSPRGSKRRRLAGASWEDTFAREEPERKKLLDYVALRCLIEEVVLTPADSEGR